MYVVEKRYQCWKREGISWTKWFVSFSSPKFETESGANEYIKTQPKKVLKLLHEYRVISIDHVVVDDVS